MNDALRSSLAPIAEVFWVAIHALAPDNIQPYVLFCSKGCPFSAVPISTVSLGNARINRCIPQKSDQLSTEKFKYYFIIVLIRQGMTEVLVTRKGQITIPMEIRRKYGIEVGSRVEVVEEGGKIIIRKLPSIFDLAGNGAGKASVEELKRMLDEMREENA